jgi:hypothetical protein
MTVCIPSEDYYARRGDWERREIKFVDIDSLLEKLAQLRNS